MTRTHTDTHTRRCAIGMTGRKGNIMTIVLKSADINGKHITAELTYRWDRPSYSVHVSDADGRTETVRHYTADGINAGFAYYVRKCRREGVGA